MNVLVVQMTVEMKHLYEIQYFLHRKMQLVRR